MDVLKSLDRSSRRVVPLEGLQTGAVIRPTQTRRSELLREAFNLLNQDKVTPTHWLLQVFIAATTVVSLSPRGFRQDFIRSQTIRVIVHVAGKDQLIGIGLFQQYV